MPVAAAAESDSDDELEDEGLGAAARWKRQLAERANALFSKRGADLQSFIYGKRAVADDDGTAALQLGDEDASDSDDSDDDFFTLK